MRNAQAVDELIAAEMKKLFPRKRGRPKAVKKPRLRRIRQSAGEAIKGMDMAKGTVTSKAEYPRFHHYGKSLWGRSVLGVDAITARPPRVPRR